LSRGKASAESMSSESSVDETNNHTRSLTVALLDPEKIVVKGQGSSATVRERVILSRGMAVEIPGRLIDNYLPEDKTFTRRYKYSRPSSKDLTRMRSSLPWERTSSMSPASPEVP
jgi:hypothetical protein